MSTSTEVLVGRIGKPHGLRGDVTIDVRTDEPELRFAPGSRLRTEAPRGSRGVRDELEVASSRWHQGVLLVTFEGVGDRDGAEALRDTLLRVTLPSDATPADADEYYDHQLVGLAVLDLEGTRIGEVRQVLHGAAQDLLGVRTPDGRDALVPFVAALVPEVDLDAGHVVVADRPGLVAPFADEQAEQAADEQAPGEA
ncbi:ribosome maturation factor RimM [Nocardioides zeae]|uniref:Ribosome maturation factor RimM n=1 Tax=Nocardioides imazamoxiresistens TaxID=3231893 RepID=A0ABU3PXG1_9ACTN|nr:ribosome maturation factor RimM [Nocardioides zeae]MDT9593881.1 ribosome maturation factor RimM [Nocardioides zeae]